MTTFQNTINHKQLITVLSIYNFLKVKLCYRTYWEQWVGFIIFLIVIILGSEYADYTTKRVLEHEREKAIERLELAKEKDSVENPLY